MENMVNEAREYALLEKIYFERCSGTPEEEKAADIICEELKTLGLNPVKEAFDVQKAEIVEASLEVLEPYQKSYKVKGYMCAKSTDGLEGELYYLTDDSDVSKKNAKGKIVLVNGYVGQSAYKRIVEAGAIGFISFNGNIDVGIDNLDIDRKELRDTKDLEKMPGVNMLVTDAMELVAKKASKVKMILKQEDAKAVSHNIIVDIDGENNDEVIVYTAHYDSVPFSKGAYDNGTGSVCLFEAAAYFNEHKPQRHMRFIWCGSEERGLLGSKAYCQAHKEEMKKIILCINVDMIGSILGRNIAVVTGATSIQNYIDYFGKEVGYPVKVSQDVYSSDSTPFADEGVPAISFARITPQGGGSIHSRFDLIDRLNSTILALDTSFIISFAKRVDSAYVNMIERTMPENMIKALNKYLRLDEKKNKEEKKD